MSRRSRRFVPAFSNLLENRRLLTAPGQGQYGEYILAIAQDDSDNVALASGSKIKLADGFQDIHITVQGIPSKKSISTVNVKTSDDEWEADTGHYEAYWEQATTKCDIYVETLHTGAHTYTVTLNYTSGESSHSSTADIYNTTPFNATTPTRVVNSVTPATTYTKLGYGSSSDDITNPSTATGADNLIDYRIGINNIILGYNNLSLSNPGGTHSPYGNYVELTNVPHDAGVTTYTWSSQPNWSNFSKSSTAWDAQLVSGADYYGTSSPPYQDVLLFQWPASVPSLSNLSLKVHYIGGLIDTIGPPISLSGSPPATTTISSFALTSYYLGNEDRHELCTAGRVVDARLLEVATDMFG